MKKIYKAPTTKIHNVGVHHMLCESPNGLKGTMDEPAVTPNDPNSNLGKEDFGW